MCLTLFLLNFGASLARTCLHSLKLMFLRKAFSLDLRTSHLGLKQVDSKVYMLQICKNTYAICKVSMKIALVAKISQRCEVTSM